MMSALFNRTFLNPTLVFLCVRVVIDADKKQIATVML